MILDAEGNARGFRLVDDFLQRCNGQIEELVGRHRLMGDHVDADGLDSQRPAQLARPSRTHSISNSGRLAKLLANKKAVGRCPAAAASALNSWMPAAVAAEYFLSG